MEYLRKLEVITGILFVMEEGCALQVRIMLFIADYAVGVSGKYCSASTYWRSKLDGTNLAYLHNRPVTKLLYSVRQTSRFGIYGAIALSGGFGHTQPGKLVVCRDFRDHIL